VFKKLLSGIESDEIDKGDLEKLTIGIFGLQGLKNSQILQYDSDVTLHKEDRNDNNTLKSYFKMKYFYIKNKTDLQIWLFQYMLEVMKMFEIELQEKIMSYIILFAPKKFLHIYLI
jgi:hypothetical protein